MEAAAHLQKAAFAISAMVLISLSQCSHGRSKSGACTKHGRDNKCMSPTALSADKREPGIDGYTMELMGIMLRLSWQVLPCATVVPPCWSVTRALVCHLSTESSKADALDSSHSCESLIQLHGQSLLSIMICQHTSRL